MAGNDLRKPFNLTVETQNTFEKSALARPFHLIAVYEVAATTVSISTVVNTNIDIKANSAYFYFAANANFTANTQISALIKSFYSQAINSHNIILNFEHLADGSTNLNFGDDVSAVIDTVLDADFSFEVAAIYAD
ncbi:MAG TPA: hypothetical protein PLR79_08520, partial [Acinetobacter sp.]|nr:hypothetical protein [Acinetobacter sp.]